MSERSRLRLTMLQMLVISLFATLLARLYVLQVLAGDQYDVIARNNNKREVVEPAPRGRLLDDRGRALVTNRSALVVTVSRADVRRQPDDGRAVLNRLSKILRIPYATLDAMIEPCGPDVPEPCWNGSPFQPVPVAEDVTAEVAFRIEEHREDFPGVEASLQAVRTYPWRGLAAHTLGYVSPISPDELKKKEYAGYRPTDLIGRGGVEQAYDRDLRGRDGVQTVAVNRLDRVTGVLATNDPVSGNDVVLSLDIGVQQVVERALAAGIARARTMTDRDDRPFLAPSGAAVVLEAKTGRIVAIASNPTYDPSAFIGGISQREYAALTSEESGYPLTSRATQGEFAPGSTFKIVTTASVVDEGAASFDGYYDCPGRYEVGNAHFKNFEGRGEGRLTLHGALVKSCDTIFYRFAFEDYLRDKDAIDNNARPREAMQAMARAFGFGRRTGVDLPSEQDGRIIDRAFKQRRWENNRKTYCAEERRGYPEITDPDRREFLTRLAAENCSDGFRFTGGDQVIFAVGQGETTVTLLQQATAYAAVANGGTLLAPRLAKAVIGPDGRVVRTIAPRVRGTLPVQPEVLTYMRNALAQVPVSGTARGAFAGFPLNLLPIAGKTGTAEVYGKQDTSWFASFAPAHDPTYVVVVMVEQAGQGGRVAAPIVREIYEGIYGIGRPAALPGGRTPTALPRIAPDGTVTGPSLAPVPPLVPPPPAPVTSSSPAALPTPTRRRG